MENFKENYYENVKEAYNTIKEVNDTSKLLGLNKADLEELEARKIGGLYHSHARITREFDMVYSLRRFDGYAQMIDYIDELGDLFYFVESFVYGKKKFQSDVDVRFELAKLSFSLGLGSRLFTQYNDELEEYFKNKIDELENGKSYSKTKKK